MYKNSETGMESMIEPRLSFSQMLVSNGLVSQIVIDYVRQKQAVEGQKLGRMLVVLGFISAKDLARQLAIQRGIEFRAVPAVDPEGAAAFNRSLCLTHHFLPVGREGDKLRVLLGEIGRA